MDTTPCPVCGCNRIDGDTAHAVAGALIEDDLDRAMEAGLLTCADCDNCADGCTTRLHVARAARLGALAARTRYRARAERLQRRAAERAEARAISPALPASTDASPPRATLPSAAAAALARAKAKASGRSPS